MLVHGADTKSGVNFQAGINSRSITADRNGNVYVCGHNDECIRRFNFNAQDGYTSVLIKAGDHGLGKPVMIRWCNSMPYLVVAHVINEKISISMVNVE